MKICLFVHAIASCWNNGNAHFLRGIAGELMRRGHEVRVLEPIDGWSRQNLLAQEGPAALDGFAAAFPSLRPILYDPLTLDLDQMLDEADLVLAHEWNESALIARLGRHRRAGGTYKLLFHDTHHRALTEGEAIGSLDLEGYDGVLAFGEAIRQIYLRRGWAERVWTWHEAADTALFRPRAETGGMDGDLVWIGNWGDGERTAELEAYLLEPIRQLRLKADIHGVRYPDAARARIAAVGARFAGWLSNHRVPEVFAQHRVTVHVPRRPYVEHLPGIPTIRVFEALACGIPLVSSPWSDTEGLFRAGEDYLLARNPEEMTRHLRMVLAEPALARSLRSSGLARIRERHSCAHRVEALLAILAELGGMPSNRPLVRAEGVSA
jgi:spore maturation protein CgeB